LTKSVECVTILPVVTIKQIAALAEVSPSTVVNVLHDRRQKVSNVTCEKVRRILRETRYVPNIAGRILKKQNSRLIGVVLTWARRAEQNAVQDPFFSEIIGALEQEIRSAGYFMLLYTAVNVEECVRMAGSWNVEGLILLGCLRDDCSWLMRNSSLPLVFIDSYFNDDGLPYTCVGLQDRRGSFLLTEYLIQQGHRRIAFLADGSPPMGLDFERLSGFREAMARYHLPVREEDYLPLSYKAPERHDFLRRFARERLKGYTALTFSSDFYAMDAMTLFYDLGIRVPGDVSICGYDGNIFAGQCRPQLTTIKQDVTAKAVLAVSRVMSLIRKETLPEPVTRLEVSLAVGDSVRDLSR